MRPDWPRHTTVLGKAMNPSRTWSKPQNRQSSEHHRCFIGDINYSRIFLNSKYAKGGKCARGEGTSQIGRKYSAVKSWKSTGRFISASVKMNRVSSPNVSFQSCSKLNHKSKFRMAAMAHCVFHDMVSMKSQKLKGAYVVEGKRLGHQDLLKPWANEQDRRRAHTYCSKSLARLGRGFNAAKNIMFKYFTKHSMVSEESWCT